MPDLEVKLRTQVLILPLWLRMGIRIPNTKTLAVLLFAAVFLSSGANALAGPFGLERGMTEQIIQIIGQKAVKENKGDVLVVTTARYSSRRFRGLFTDHQPEAGPAKNCRCRQRHRDEHLSGDELR